MKNKYKVEGDTVCIFLTKKTGEVFETRVSLSSMSKLLSTPTTWCAHNRKTGKCYVRARKPGTKTGENLQLHRFVTDAPEGTVVDHINGDTLDNTLDNLRIVTQVENGRNRNSLNKNNTSGHQGVWYDKRKQKWVAEIWILGKKHHLGTFIDKELACQVRDEEVRRYEDSLFR
jgi:hypothetical protein